MQRVELRKAHRYGLSLPVTVHAPTHEDSPQQTGRTRDISTRGVYFLIEADIKSGNPVSLTMTLPTGMTRGTDVLVNVTGKIVRVDDFSVDNFRKIGVAVSIEEYEIVRSNSAPA